MTYQNHIDITAKLVADHGLKPDEFEKIVALIGRQPTYTELGIFSAMWNEHCSYKSSKKWLKTLPTTGPKVIQGPGENAGVVDIDDGDVVVFKMESHNHPSYIEPYQGAATGVGGILRDVFTMGARPIAAMNALRFGAPDHAKTKHLVSGVVAGVGGYGNSFVVPTVGGVPVAILAINVVGAFLLGMLAEALLRRGDDTGRRRRLRLLLGTGVLGGFTTYSALAADAAVLLAVDLSRGLLYVGGTLVLGALATFAGIAAGAAMSGRPAADERGADGRGTDERGGRR